MRHIITSIENLWLIGLWVGLSVIIITAIVILCRFVRNLYKDAELHDHVTMAIKSMAHHLDANKSLYKEHRAEWPFGKYDSPGEYVRQACNFLYPFAKKNGTLITLVTIIKNRTKDFIEKSPIADKEDKKKYVDFVVEILNKLELEDEAMSFKINCYKHLRLI